MTQFIEKSFEAHQGHYNTYAEDEKFESHAAVWLRKDTVDHWRHHRIRASVQSLLSYFPAAKWLTVGDGRLGLDAAFIEERGGTAHATDISDALLKVAYQKKIVREFSAQNCEKLNFEDTSFDFVLCKESYHHFPRPFVALYEMLRVSRKAVVLLEPQDPLALTNIRSIFFTRTVRFAKKLLGKTSPIHEFEDSGNYVYTLSKRDCEKLALGIGLRWVAFKEMSDVYLPGVETATVDPESKLYRKVRKKIELSDRLIRWGLRPGNVLIAIIFKETPSSELQQKLSVDGFEVRELPENPYLK